MNDFKSIPSSFSAVYGRLLLWVVTITCTFYTTCILATEPGTSSSSPWIHPGFPRYEWGSSLVPAWIITNSSVSCIHRFFDSSPISPSGRYIALTRMFVQENEHVSVPPPLADVVVYDLHRGQSSERVVARTAAWDLQVGAHVQWGISDDFLYYNTLSTPNHTTPTNLLFTTALRGMEHNIHTGSRRELGCAVYQISPNGKFGLSPDLTKVYEHPTEFFIILSLCRNAHTNSV